MDSSERRELVLGQLRANGRVGVEELAEISGCSPMTIRRDLDLLARVGVLRRIHGGAISLLTAEETPYPVRARTAAAAKQRIGRAAAQLLNDAETVLLDGGTTALEVARHLHDRQLTVTPLSLHTAQALQDAAGIRLVVPGGDVRPVELTFVGTLTLDALAMLRFDTAILGCCGLDVSDGLTGHDLHEAAIKRAGLSAARRRIVVADANKWNTRTFARFAALDDVDVIVTDTDAPDEHVAALRERDTDSEIEVHRV